MPKKTLERYWNGPSDLSGHQAVGGAFADIRSDIHAGRVFPALRENEIHLYHEGGRVLRVTPQSAYSHGQYLHGHGTVDVSLSRKPLTSTSYQELKANCRAHNSQPLRNNRAFRETWIVSRLFERFSVWADNAESGQPRLIDVEVRLRSTEGRAPEMVDLLFLDHDARLTFVEVKRQYDSRVRAKDPNGKPEVVYQVRGYEHLLRRHPGHILLAYRDVGEILRTAFRLESVAFDAPKEVFGRVPILVCRRDAKTGQDNWLRKRLETCANGRIEPDHLVIDGGAIENAGAAYAGGRPPWLNNGEWGNVNLEMLFAEIRDLRDS